MSATVALPAARRLGTIFERVASLVPAGRPQRNWPIRPGRYRLGDPSGSIAVCALTSNGLLRDLAGLPGVAIAGGVYTPNLGIERIVNATVANPRIRTLFVCGKDSPVFRPGQALTALAANGLDDDGTIRGADGLLAALPATSRSAVEEFREQVSIVAAIGVTDATELAARIATVPQLPPVAPRFELPDAEASFVELRPGGNRQPLEYDHQGFFVISVEAGSIVVHHYLADRRPAYVIRGRSAEPILLGLMREGLVSKLSHAGYLGAELAKAETALRLA
jgi:tetrahydromethanopterin S-methyltransferase subunit A